MDAFWNRTLSILLYLYLPSIYYIWSITNITTQCQSKDYWYACAFGVVFQCGTDQFLLCLLVFGSSLTFTCSHVKQMEFFFHFLHWHLSLHYSNSHVFARAWACITHVNKNKILDDKHLKTICKRNTSRVFDCMCQWRHKYSCCRIPTSRTLGF